MATILQKNMYVRCPFDREYPRIPRDFVTGQILEIDEIADTAKVIFRDPFNFCAFYENVPSDPINCPLQLLSHVSAYKGTYVLYKSQKYEVVYTIKEDEWFFYYIRNEYTNQSLKIREDQIVIPFVGGEISPLEQIKKFEFQNPVWYTGRAVVGKTIKILENSVYGFKELAGCKIHLLPHQLNSIMRCLQDDKCRFMLADEVGMGKTIEASSVLKIFLLHNSRKKVLIAVPSPLIEQWRTELFLKFTIEEGCDKKNNEIQLISTEEMADYCKDKWDFVIVDEVHKLLDSKEKYEACHALSRNSDNILLLSATPVQQKEEQYLNLLKLIMPEKYDSVGLDDFTEQVGKQKKITRLMYNILADLEDLNDNFESAIENEENPQEDDDCVSVYEDVFDGLKDVSKLINDEFLKDTIKEVDEDCSLQGKEKMQEAVIYICDNYQLENNILRNRRGLISSDMAKRELVELGYILDPERNTYEAATYEAIVDWVTGQELSSEEFEKHYIPLLEAFFSSAWAFNEELLKKEQAGMNVSDEVKKQASEWKREEEELLKNIEEVLAEPYNYSNRMVSVIDYIDQELVDNRIVLFTNYAETYEKYEMVLKSYFGDSQVAVFNKRLNADVAELEIYRFQNDSECRILLCDETGGEGRNLQNADVVIHIDLPWDANSIEQRIGRLDRLGRNQEKNVVSIVAYTEETLEHELVKFWRDGLSVFSKSLSGLEIIMNEINESIISAVVHDFRYGISSAIEEVVQSSQKMEKDVRQEQLYDTASFIYGNMNQQLKVTLEKYRKNENQLFANSMMGWATLAGFKGEPNNHGTIKFSEASFSVGSAVKSLFIPPLWEEYINSSAVSFARKIQELYEKKVGRKNTSSLRIIEGTFDREQAIQNDYLHFFAPGDDVFDSIVDNALHSDKGQCAAFVHQTDFEWQGFIFSFSLEPNTKMILENDIPITAIGRFKSYIAMDQIVVPVGFDRYSDVPVERVLDQLEKISKCPVSKQKGMLAHLGKRKPDNDFLHIKSRFNISNYEWFSNKYPSDVWESYVDIAYKKALAVAKSRFSKSSSLKSASREVERMMSTELSKSRYYGTKPEELESIKERYMLIIEALKKSKIVVETAAFVWMVNTDE